MMAKLKPLPATTIFYIRNAFGAFTSGLIITALYIYYARTVGLTPLQLALMGSVLMLTSLIFEVPTGVVADVYSRKWSVIIGSVLSGISFILIGTFPIFAIILFAAFLEAVGDTFVSGALDAWLADEIGADKIGTVILRAEQLGTLPHWAGVLMSVLLSTLFMHQVPIVLGGALWLGVSLMLIFMMPETGFVRPVNTQPNTTFAFVRDGANQMLTTLREGMRLVRTHGTLRRLLVAQLFMGAFLEGFFRLNNLHLFTGFALPTLSLPFLGVVDESIWAALIAGGASGLYLIAIAVLRRLVDVNDVRRAPVTLFTLYALIGLVTLTFALTSNFAIAALTACVAWTLHNLTEPVVRTWLNQYITSDARATVLSMNSQVNQLGQLGGGLGIGALGNVAGLRIALSASTLFIIPLLTLLRRQARTQTIQMHESNPEAHT